MGASVRRVEEVFECWFESGSMPFASAHYPFENKESFLKNFPGDFVSEDIDQTRGWFYTLLILSTHLFGTAPWKNLIVTGLVLAADGKKLRTPFLPITPDPVHVPRLLLYLVNLGPGPGVWTHLPHGHLRDLRRCRSLSVTRPYPQCSPHSPMSDFPVSYPWSSAAYRDRVGGGLEKPFSSEQPTYLSLTQHSAFDLSVQLELPVADAANIPLPSLVSFLERLSCDDDADEPRPSMVSSPVPDADCVDFTTRREEERAREAYTRPLHSVMVYT